MLVKISDIKIGSDRRNVAPNDALALSKSVAEIGLLNPITISTDYILIAGRHRLEAVKLLGWSEIECTISNLDGLRAELAEIDENFVRTSLTHIEFGDLLLRRKEIYEILHPETKATYEGGSFRGNQHESEVAADSAATSKSFVRDTAERLGMAPRTIRERLQTAKNLTPQTKNIIKKSDADISKTNALKLSRLEPDQQEQAATQLVTGEIKSVDEYKKPYSLGDKVYATLEESIADMKNTEKDTSYTADMLLASIDGMVQDFHRDFSWYDEEICVAVFPQVSEEQFEFIKQQFSTITSAMVGLVERIGRSRQNEQ